MLENLSRLITLLKGAKTWTINLSFAYIKQIPKLISNSQAVTSLQSMYKRSIFKGYLQNQCNKINSSTGCENERKWICLTSNNMPCKCKNASCCITSHLPLFSSDSDHSFFMLWSHLINKTTLSHPHHPLATNRWINVFKNSWQCLPCYTFTRKILNIATWNIKNCHLVWGQLITSLLW